MKFTKNCNIFSLPGSGTTDHEANINFRAICNCYATAQNNDIR